MSEEREPKKKSSRSERVFTGTARAVVSLMWAILLVVAVVVAYLAARFYGG